MYGIYLKVVRIQNSQQYINNKKTYTNLKGGRIMLDDLYEVLNVDETLYCFFDIKEQTIQTTTINWANLKDSK